MLLLLELNDSEIALDVHIQIANAFLQEVVYLFRVVVPCGNLQHHNL
jgi:hypothetical protein